MQVGFCMGVPVGFPADADVRVVGGFHVGMPVDLRVGVLVGLCVGPNVGTLVGRKVGTLVAKRHVRYRESASFILVMPNHAQHSCDVESHVAPLAVGFWVWT